MGVEELKVVRLRLHGLIQLILAPRILSFKLMAVDSHLAQP